jgi:hypothetical protein
MLAQGIKIYELCKLEEDVMTGLIFCLIVAAVGIAVFLVYLLAQMMTELVNKVETAFVSYRPPLEAEECGDSHHIPYLPHFQQISAPPPEQQRVIYTGAADAALTIIRRPRVPRPPVKANEPLPQWQYATITKWRRGTPVRAICVSPKGKTYRVRIKGFRAGRLACQRLKGGPVFYRTFIGAL